MGVRCVMGIRESKKKISIISQTKQDAHGLAKQSQKITAKKLNGYAKTIMNIINPSLNKMLWFGGCPICWYE